MIIDSIIKEIEKKTNQIPGQRKYIKIKMDELREIMIKDTNNHHHDVITECLNIIEETDKEKLRRKQILFSKKISCQTNYILMLSINYQMALKLDKFLIYDISESMTGVYYDNYSKCLAVLTNKNFANLLSKFNKIKQEKDIDYLSSFLKNMIEELNTKEMPYLEAFINAYIRDFITENNINQSLISTNGQNNGNMLEDDKKKHFKSEIDSIIAESKEVNQIIHKSLIAKSHGMKTLQDISQEDFDKIMDYYIWLHDDEIVISRFHIAAYTLNLLELRKYTNIKKISFEKLHELSTKYNIYKFDQYQEMFSDELYKKAR